jgi:hypothetical protein
MTTPPVFSFADIGQDIVGSATPDVAGIARLYNESGSNTNGAMTQSAVTTAFNDAYIAGADLLDGQHGSYYQNAANLNAGTLPAARLPAHTGEVTSSAGSAALTLTASSVLSKLLTVDGTGSGLDADLLDGQHASSFVTPGTDVQFKTLKLGSSLGMRNYNDGQLTVYNSRDGSLDSNIFVYRNGVARYLTAELDYPTYGNVYIQSNSEVFRSYTTSIERNTVLSWATSISIAGSIYGRGDRLYGPPDAPYAFAENSSDKGGVYICFKNLSSNMIVVFYCSIWSKIYMRIIINNVWFTVASDWPQI